MANWPFALRQRCTLVVLTLVVLTEVVVFAETMGLAAATGLAGAAAGGGHLTNLPYASLQGAAKAGEPAKAASEAAIKSFLSMHRLPKAQDCAQVFRRRLTFLTSVRSTVPGRPEHQPSDESPRAG